MRYITVRLVPGDGAFGTVERDVVAATAVSRVAIHYVNVLDDGTVVMLEEFAGDPGRLTEIYDGQSNVLAYSLTRSGERIFLHVHFRANDTVADLLRLPQEHDVVVDTPMEYTDDGALVVTFVGEQAEFQRMVSKVPDGVDIGVEQLGEYRPEAARLFAELTERQQRTLKLAVERGYFEVPRRTTCEELGAELGVSASAVSNQLRRIQASILSAVVPDG